MEKKLSIILFLAGLIGLNVMGNENADINNSVVIKVLTYNIRHCEGTDKVLDVDRIASIIKSVSPDIVALQEVDQKTKRSQRIDEPTELAVKTGLNYVYGPAIDYSGGKYGNALLSRYPIKSYIIHSMPSLKEDRSLIEANLELSPNINLKFFATHLSLVLSEREESAKLLNSLITDNTPALFAGDLNAYKGDGTSDVFFNELAQKWRSSTTETVPTFPADKPIRQIDFIFYDNQNSWKVIDVKVINEPVASDHRPLLVTLELNIPQISTAKI